MKTKDPELCPVCDGSGRIYASYEDGEGRKCSWCDGTGTISDPQRLAEAERWKTMEGAR